MTGDFDCSGWQAILIAHDDRPFWLLWMTAVFLIVRDEMNFAGVAGQELLQGLFFLAEEVREAGLVEDVGAFAA